MKKLVLTITVLFAVLSLSACGQDEVYKVGATPVPHSEILEYVKPLLEEQGYEFEVVEFTDYVLPNSTLASGEIIANFFQHIPYLNAQIDEYGYDFVNVGGVHVEPIGLYSTEYDSLDALPNDLELIISNSPTDRPRLLGVLDENGIIDINSSVTNEDIIASTVGNLTTLFTSSYNISFVEVAPELLYANYNNDSGDAVLINGNFALDNGLNPLEDALCLEGSASLYVNILVATAENEDNEFVQALIETLQSKDVSDWIKENYGGAVVPVN